MKKKASGAVLFVFYEATRGRRWKYRVPASLGWWFVGSGSTGSAMYPNEDQIQGPASSAGRAEQYLERKFGAMLRQNRVTRYAIRSSYSLPPASAARSR
jgi:hypothetical protein